LNQAVKWGWLNYLLAITTSMREGELSGLHWEDVDLKNGQIHVKHQVQFISGQGLIITEPKTDESRRTIDLTPTAAQVLERPGGGSGLVFKTSNDTPISPQKFAAAFSPNP
jgi:integrase